MLGDYQLDVQRYISCLTYPNVQMPQLRCATASLAACPAVLLLMHAPGKPSLTSGFSYPMLKWPFSLLCFAMGAATLCLSASLSQLGSCVHSCMLSLLLIGLSVSLFCAISSAVLPHEAHHC